MKHKKTSRLLALSPFPPLTSFSSAPVCAHDPPKDLLMSPKAASGLAALNSGLGKKEVGRGESKKRKEDKGSGRGREGNGRMEKKSRKKETEGARNRSARRERRKGQGEEEGRSRRERKCTF